MRPRLADVPPTEASEVVVISSHGSPSGYWPWMRTGRDNVIRGSRRRSGPGLAFASFMYVDDSTRGGAPLLDLDPLQLDRHRQRRPLPDTAAMGGGPQHARGPVEEAQVEHGHPRQAGVVGNPGAPAVGRDVDADVGP